MIIATRVLDKDTNIYITDPNLEIIILYCRIALKAKTKHNIHLSKNDQKEIAYLKERLQTDIFKKLCKQLIDKEGETLYKLIMEEDLSCEGWYRVYQIASYWLKPYRKYSPIYVFLRHKYYLTLYLFFLLANRKFNCCFINRKTFPNRHLSICFLGQDGSGKSTVTIELCKWLNWKIEAHRFYLGSGEHYKSLTKRLSSRISRFRKKEDNQSHKEKVTCNQSKNKKKNLSNNTKSFVASILVSWSLLGVARRAYKEVRRADRYMKNGGIPLFDRFPQVQFEGIYDGPKINHYCQQKGISNGIVKWMARREQRYLEKMQCFQPTLVFKLMLTPEESIRRKPFENLETVIESGVDYDTDTSYIYYVRTTPVTRTFSIDPSYTVSDHGLEFLTGTTIPCECVSIYGNDLKNKLIRDVVTKSQDFFATDMPMSPSDDTTVSEELTALNSKISGLPEVLSSGTVSSTTYDFAYKFPNGALICVHSISVTPSSWTAWGNCYESNKLSLGSWLVEFTSQPLTMISQGSTSSGGWIENHDQISKTSCGQTYIVRPNAGTGLSFRVSVVGYGYWK